jgi:hypothetical protein
MRKHQKGRILACGEMIAAASDQDRKHPSGAKAHVDSIAFAARLKSCPFKTPTSEGFFTKL